MGNQELTVPTLPLTTLLHAYIHCMYYNNDNVQSDHQYNYYPEVTIYLMQIVLTCQLIHMMCVNLSTQQIQSTPALQVIPKELK